MKNHFFKGHGLGNDYIALDPSNLTFKLTPRNIRTICDRNWGIGSDGILALQPSTTADFGLRIYNPDGSCGGRLAQWLGDRCEQRRGHVANCLSHSLPSMTANLEPPGEFRGMLGWILEPIAVEAPQDRA